ncbi:MAG: zinc metalloprotease HtpX [Deltaproteobacteria bacterium]|nr:zinc metalloprotease HtpX [Deltaproteobacteria bacterium]
MRNHIRTVVLLGSLSALVLGLGALVAPGYLYVFGALALAMNLGAYFFSDRIVLRMHGAREVSPSEAPDLHQMVRELSREAGIPKPRVCLMPEDQPNAFATGRNPKHGVVAVTEGLVRVLDRRELRAVIAHELAHIKNRDILVSSIAAAAASLITYVAQMLTFSSIFGGSDEEENSGQGAGAIVVALVAPIAATLIQLGISRSREYLADETGARLCGDPEALASALLKLQAAPASEDGAGVTTPTPATASLFIVNPMRSVSSVAGLFSTHPATERRVMRLRALAAEGRRNGARTSPGRPMASATSF